MERWVRLPNYLGASDIRLGISQVPLEIKVDWLEAAVLMYESIKVEIV